MVQIEAFRVEYEAKLTEEFRSKLLELDRPIQKYLLTIFKPEQGLGLREDFDNSHRHLRSLMGGDKFRKERLDYLFGYHLWIAIAITTILASGLTAVMGWWIRRKSDIPIIVFILGFVIALCLGIASLLPALQQSILPFLITLLVCPLLFSYFAGRNSPTKPMRAGIHTCVVAGTFSLLIIYMEAVVGFWKTHLYLLFNMGCMTFPNPYRLESWILWTLGTTIPLICIFGTLGGGMAILERKLRRKLQK